MGVQINRGEPGSRHVGILDPGTGTVKQAEGPVTFEQPVGNRQGAGTAVKQQPKTVAYRDPARNEQATGAVEQVSEPVVTADPAAKVLRKQVKQGDVEDKAVKGAEDKARPKSRTRRT